MSYNGTHRRNVGRVEQIRRLRYLVNNGQITLRQAIAWYFGKTA